MAIEDATLRLGRLAVTPLITAWLSDRAAKADQSGSMSDLIAVSIRDRFHRREFERQLERIGDQTARRLDAIIAIEYREADPAELGAALDEAIEALQHANFGDTELFGCDLDVTELTRRVRLAIPPSAGAHLSEAGAAFKDLMIGECCQTIVTLVRRLPEFQQRGIVELMRRLTDIADAVEKAPRLILEALDESSGDTDFKNAYFGQISNNLEFLETFYVDARNYSPRISVAATYLNLSVSRSGPRRGHVTQPESGWQDFSNNRSRRRDQSVESVLKLGDRVLIRGEAGSGKTTLLQWIAVHCARRSFRSELRDWNGLTPFFIRLRSFANRAMPSLPEFIGDAGGVIGSRMSSGWTHRRLQSSDAILLVDGVDELLPRERPKVQQWLSDLLAEYPKLTVIVTSRPAAASSKWLAAQRFETLDIEPMSFGDVDDFCDRWHEAVASAGRTGEAQLPCRIEDIETLYRTTLTKQLEARPDLRQLATSPLLCALICALNLTRRSSLPLDRMELYRSAIELLIDRRDADRSIPAPDTPTIDMGARLAILQRLAWRMALQGRAEMSIEDASEHVAHVLRRLRDDTDPAEAMQFLLERSGLIREPILGRLDFVHRTFQDYLAGKEAAEDHYFQELVDSAHRDQWRGTIVMAAGHATNPNRAKLLTGILDRSESEQTRARSLKLLAGGALDTCKQLDTDTAARVEAAVRSLLPPRRVSEVASLVTAGRSVLIGLPKDLTALSATSAAACVRTAALINGEGAMALLAGYASDDRDEVQQEIADAWRYFEPESYVDEVLKQAPLREGAIAVSTVVHAKLLCRLPQVAHSFISGDVGPGSRAWISSVPGLTTYEGRGPSVVEERDVLRAHAATLKKLYVTVDPPRDNLRAISGLPLLERLSIGCGWQVTNLRFLDWFEPSLTELWLHDTARVSDYSPVGRFRNLIDFTVFNANHLTSLEYLHDCALRELWLANSGLKGDLTFLEPWRSSLRMLVMYEAGSIDSLKGLNGLELTTLTLTGRKWTDLSPLQGMDTLVDVELSVADSCDLSPLTTLPELKRLALAGAKGVDLTCFGGVTQRLAISQVQEPRGLKPLPANVSVVL